MNKELSVVSKEAGRRIDPATAEVMWVWAETMDPYGDDPKLPPELQQTGREYFARSHDGPWVHLGDLPDATRLALRQRVTPRMTPEPTGYGDLTVPEKTAS